MERINVLERIETDFDFACFVVERFDLQMHTITPNRSQFYDKARKIKIYFLIITFYMIIQEKH